MSDRVALAHAIAARSKAIFIEIERERKRRVIVVRRGKFVGAKKDDWAGQERTRLIREWDRS
jgi:hypothetical protein